MLCVDRDADLLITMTVSDDITAERGAVVRRFTDPAATSVAVARFIDAAGSPEES